MIPGKSFLFPYQDPRAGYIEKNKEELNKIANTLIELRNNSELFEPKPWGIISIKEKGIDDETILYKPRRDETFIYLKNKFGHSSSIHLPIVLENVSTIHPFKLRDVRFAQYKSIFLISGANEYNISPHLEIFRQVNISEVNPNIPISPFIEFHTTHDGRRIRYFQPFLEGGWGNLEETIFQQEIVFLDEKQVEIIDPQRKDGGEGLRLGYFDTRLYDFTGAPNSNTNSTEFAAGAVIY
ncbi:MAG: hypothetical protein ABIC57_03505 [bacterium]